MGHAPRLHGVTTFGAANQGSMRIARSRFQSAMVEFKKKIGDTFLVLEFLKMDIASQFWRLPEVIRCIPIKVMESKSSSFFQSAKL